MKTSGRFYLLFSITLILLSCTLVNIVSSSGKDDCEKKGGTWKQVTSAEGKTTEYCEQPVYVEGKACTADPANVWTVSEVLKDETSQFGGRLCDFRTKFITNLSQQVWIMTYQHEADVWAKTDEGRWTVHRLDGAVENPLDLDADEFYSSIELEGWYNYYNEKDAVGPSMLVYEKYAAILDTPDCAPLREDDEYLELVAKPIEPACKP